MSDPMVMSVSLDLNKTFNRILRPFITCKVPVIQDLEI